MVLSMAPDAKAAEDGHVGHQREERPLVLDFSAVVFKLSDNPLSEKVLRKQVVA